MQETQVQYLGQEDPMEKGMATHSSVFAWRIPWTEEPGGLQSMESQRVGHKLAANTFTFPAGSAEKIPPANAGATGEEGSIPGSGRSPGGGHGNPPQYSCLGNPMDRGAWRAAVHGVAESQT